jgi:transcriptional regulator with XRE-family HTH domain
MMDSNVQGERVADLSRAAGLSQRDLAEETGISQPTISRIVTGARAASMPELVSIAWALGVPVEDLIEERTLDDRVLVAPRAQEPTADASEVRRRLVGYLRMELHLDALGVPTECG